MSAALRPILLLSLCATLGPIEIVGQPADPETRYQNLTQQAVAAHGGEIDALFAELVSSKKELTGLDHYHAIVEVRVDLARRLLAADQNASAISHLQSAASLALASEDAPSLLRLYLAQLEIYRIERNAERGLPVAAEAIKLAQSSGNQTALVEATLAEITIQESFSTTYPREQTYDSLLALDGVDELAIKLHRSRLGRGSPRDQSRQERRWLEVKDMAAVQNRPDIEAEAWEALAWIAYHQNELALASERFKSAESIGQRISRTAKQWGNYLRLLNQLGESAYALEIVNRELAAADSPQESGFKAELQDARALLLSTEGNFPAAYAALRQATDLRNQEDFAPQFFQPAKMSIANASEFTDSVQVDAAIRTAQRETELALALSQRQFLIAVAAAAVLLILLLTVAYRLKRRAVAAEMLSREAAELRAENAQLLALRYQLNPHFLFNALEGLRSRFTENATTGIALLDRLTEFCRLVFTLRQDGLQTVADECAMIETFLRIEQDRWEENLVVNLDFDPAARTMTLPTMLVQPLVENALKYGAETSTQHIRIDVTTRAGDSNTLTIMISNSGHWLEATALRERSSNRIGLNNIRRRLQSYYPGRHTFTIGPSKFGVTATLTLKGPPMTLA